MPKVGCGSSIRVRRPFEPGPELALMTGVGKDDPIAPLVHLDRFASDELVREPMTNDAMLD